MSWIPGSRASRVPRNDAGVCGSAPGQFSDSHVKQRIQTDVIHRPHHLVGVGTAVISLPLTHVRERSAERRYVLVCTLRCRVPCGHAASRRSTYGVFHPGTVFRVRTRERNPALIRAGFRRPFIRTASSH